MFPPRSHTTAQTFGRSAARTARIIKAFATLELRPLDAAGRPVGCIAADCTAGTRTTARRPGTATRVQQCGETSLGGSAGEFAAL